MGGYPAMVGEQITAGTWEPCAGEEHVMDTLGRAIVTAHRMAAERLGEGGYRIVSLCHTCPVERGQRGVLLTFVAERVRS